MSDSETKTIPFAEHSAVVQKLQDADARAKNFEAKLTDMEKRFSGVNLDELRAAAAEAAELKKKGAVGDEKKINELITEAENKAFKRFEGKLSETEKERDAMRSRVTRLEVIHPANKAAADVFNPDMLELLEGIFEKSLFLDGDKIKVRGEDGKAKASIENPREDMGLNEFLGQLANKFPSGVKATNKAGAAGAGGTKNTNGHTSSGGVTPAQFAKMGPDEFLKIPPAERAALAAAVLKDFKV